MKSGGFVVALALSLALAAEARAQENASLRATPERGTHPDEGIMIAGGLTFLLGYLSAAIPILVVHPMYCDMMLLEGGDVSCESTAWGVVPIVHILAGGWDGVIAGPIGLIIETLGLFIFIGGAAHHHPNAPQPGEVAFTARLPGADVALGLEIAL